MAYYPKNKIKTNQTSTGGYNYSLTGDTYTGPYYKLANGKAYTGKFPGDGNNDELVEAKDPLDVPAIPKSLTISSVPPLHPTENDYKNGMFTRYFSKKRNEYLFEELTKDQFDKLNNSKNPLYTLYKPFFIKWMLVGEKQTVADYNFYSIKNAEEKEGVLGLNEFLQMNYLQYYK
jgi:hypothetical protein